MLLPITAFTGRLHQKGVPFSGIRYTDERVGKSTSSPGRSSLAREKRPGDKVVGKSVFFSVKRLERANRCILWL